MDEKTCSEIVKSTTEKIVRNENRLNIHGEKIDKIEQEIVGMKRDTNRLEDIMDKLELTIEKLNKTILDMKYKPLKFYEQISMFLITGVLGYVIAMLFN